MELLTGEDLERARKAAGLPSRYLERRLGERSQGSVAGAEAGAERSQAWLQKAISLCSPPTELERNTCGWLECYAPSGGRFYCDEHRELTNEKVRNVHARKKARGECHDCKSLCVDGGIFCAVHREKRRQQSDFRRRRKTPCSVCGILGHLRSDHRKTGLCCRCQRPKGHGPKKAYCAEHAAIITAQTLQIQAGLIANGFCHRCRHKPIAPRSKSRCVDCLAAGAAHERLKYQTRKATQ